MKLKVPALLVVGAILTLVVASSVAAAAPLAQMYGGGGGGMGPGPGPGPGRGGSTTLTTATSADFSGSGNCALCHSALRDSAGKDVSIDTHWRSTMMGNSARDVLWQGKVESEVTRTPAIVGEFPEQSPYLEWLHSQYGDGVGTDTSCQGCHMPTANGGVAISNRPMMLNPARSVRAPLQRHQQPISGADPRGDHG